MECSSLISRPERARVRARVRVIGHETPNKCLPPPSPPYSVWNLAPKPSFCESSEQGQSLGTPLFLSLSRRLPSSPFPSLPSLPSLHSLPKRPFKKSARPLPSSLARSLPTGYTPTVRLGLSVSMSMSMAVAVAVAMNDAFIGEGAKPKERTHAHNYRHSTCRSPPPPPFQRLGGKGTSYHHVALCSMYGLVSL